MWEGMVVQLTPNTANFGTGEKPALLDYISHTIPALLSSHFMSVIETVHATCSWGAIQINHSFNCTK